MSEELGERVFGSGGRWRVVCDPIDGSLNAKRDIPFFSLSLAVADGTTMDDVVFGYVHDFGSGEWTAERGGGAFLDGSRLGRSGRRTQSRFSPSRRRPPPRSRTRRRTWSAAPTASGSWARWRSRSAIAAGRVDAVCSLKPARSVDIAAGRRLLVRECGLEIDLFEDPPFGRAPLDLAGRSRVVAAGTIELCRALGRIDRVGCSGWNYDSWRHGVFYPEGLPSRRWLEHYARRFDTVEVNASFYRLPTVKAVQGWVEQTPGGRLRRQDEPLRHACEAAAGAGAEPRALLLADRATRALGAARPRALAAAADVPPRRRPARRGAHAAAGRPPRLRVPASSWFAPEVADLLRAHGVALMIADRPEIRAFQTHELTADWAYVRFHAGTRGRRGNYSETELREWAVRIRSWPVTEAYVYFNNGGRIRAAQRPVGSGCSSSMRAPTELGPNRRHRLSNHGGRTRAQHPASDDGAATVARLRRRSQPA